MSVQRHKIPAILGAAADLLHRQYLSAGIVGDEDGGLHHSRWLVYGPNSMLFELIRDTPNPKPHTPSLIGAIAAIGDSPLGLPMDEVYQVELDALRAQGNRLAEIGFFATSGLRPGELIELFLDLFDYLSGGGFDHFVCGAHPRNEKRYGRLTGMTRLAGERTLPGTSVPVILMGTTDARNATSRLGQLRRANTHRRYVPKNTVR